MKDQLLKWGFIQNGDLFAISNEHCDVTVKLHLDKIIEANMIINGSSAPIINAKCRVTLFSLLYSFNLLP